jgi:hypothetical protein
MVAGGGGARHGGRGRRWNTARPPAVASIPPVVQLAEAEAAAACRRALLE